MRGTIPSVATPFEQLKVCEGCRLSKPLNDFLRSGLQEQSSRCTQCTHAPAYQERLRRELKAKSKAALRPQTLSDFQRIEAERILEAERANEDAFARLREARDSCRNG